MIVQTLQVLFWRVRIVINNLIIQLQEIQFLENNENYSMQAKAFAHDAGGGEFVLLQDESVGFIGSEGKVGRIAESLYFPANIWTVRRNDSLLSDTVGMWVKELSGMTKEEMENNHEHL